MLNFAYESYVSAFFSLNTNLLTEFFLTGTKNVTRTLRGSLNSLKFDGIGRLHFKKEGPFLAW